MKVKLKVNIIVAFSALLIATVSIIFFYTQKQTSTGVDQITKDLVSTVTKNVSDETISFLKPAVQIATNLTQNPSRLLSSFQQNESLETHFEVHALDMLKMYPQISGIFVGDEKGRFLFAKQMGEGKTGIKVIDPSGELFPKFLDLLEDKGLQDLNIIGNQNTDTIQNSFWKNLNAAGELIDVRINKDDNYDPRLRPWYQGAQKAEKIFWTDTYIFFTAQKPGITVAEPYFNAFGDLIGVLGVDIELDQLSVFLEDQQVGKEGLVFIFDKKGKVIAFPKIKLMKMENEKLRPIQFTELDLPSVQKAINSYVKTGEHSFTVTENGINYFSVFTPFPSNFGKDWLIGIVVPEDDFIGFFKEMQTGIVLISLCVLLFSIGIAWWLSNSISRPIERITEEQKRIEGMNLEGDFNIDSSIREVDALSHGMVAMRNSLKAFQSYIPAELVRQLIQQGEGATLGGRERTLSIMFADIANFTSISENMDPEALMLQLSEYLGMLAETIRLNHGTVDKYLGDGVMAFWGAPVSSEQHAIHACQAALSCSKGIQEMNRSWELKGKKPFWSRFGIHTGVTLVGNLGSQSRMNYTVVGDSVNLASRLEGVNKIYKTEIIVSSDTRDAAKKDFLFRPLGSVAVKGKKQEVEIYELVESITQATEEQIQFSKDFTTALDLFKNGDFSGAKILFTKIGGQYPTDHPTKIYIEKCLEKERSGISSI
ncbi:MAG: adenylate/guanylate cyclase domain-containing protein [Proteobacteria bacterium]|nr:adenylate/guanylate cyclase domain-containing protein [Pseudomonadota bacterium]